MPKYHIINASYSVFSAPSAKGDGIVQPLTERVLELDDEYSDARLEAMAASGLFIKKSGEAAQNGQPWPTMNSDIAEARNRLMVAAGEERADIISQLRGEKKASANKKSVSTGGQANVTPADSTVQPSAATTSATAPKAGETSKMG